MTAVPRPTGLAGFTRHFADFAGLRGWIAVAASLLAVACEAAGLLLLVPLASLILAAPAGVGAPSVMQGIERAGPAGLAGLLIGLLILRAAVLWVRDNTLARLQVGFVEHLRAGLVARIVAAPWSRLAGLDHPRLIQILGSDLARSGAAAQFLIQAGAAGLLVLGQGLLAAWLSPTLTAIVAGVVLASGLVLWPLSGRARLLGQALTDANLALAEETARFLGGLKLALSHNRQGAFQAATQAASARLAQTQLRFVEQQSRSRIATTTLATLAAATTLGVGHYGLHLPAPILLTLMAVFARLSGPALQLQQAAQSLMHALPAFEAVSSAVAFLGQEGGSATPIGRSPPRGDIRLSHVDYRHGGDGAGVTRLTLEIPAGSLAGVHGPSGSGKTTLADLITGLLAPQTGDIRVGGERLAGEVLQAWQGALAYIPQDPFLLDDTVAANLRWARPDASEAEQWAALQIAGAAEFVSSLERGLETRLGERGVRLSGGERQRLILARALLRQADVMILDEALTRLPAEAERSILAAVRQARPGATILVISHRAEVIADCDLILRLDAGRLTDQIMKSGGGPAGGVVSMRNT